MGFKWDFSVQKYKISKIISKLSNMSFKAVFQFILLLHDFKNVDLPNQGLASVSVAIYKEQNNQTTFAIPYEYPHQRNYKLQKKKIRNDSVVQDMFFRSKVVVIKYSDQNVPLDDFVQFRMELEAFPYLNTDNIYLEFNLLFSTKYYNEDQKFEGKPTAQVRMKLKDIENGIFCYSEADFKQDYFSRLSFTLFGQLMFYKFEKYQTKLKQPTTKEIVRSKIDCFGKLVIWSKQNYLKAGEDPFNLFYSNYVKNLRHSNYLIQLKLNDFLIVKRKLQMKVSQKFLKAKDIQNPDFEVDQKFFRQYLEQYKPPFSVEDILQEIQQIRIDNFIFLNTIIEDFFHQQFDVQKMKEEYIGFIKQKYGERVFRNTLYQQEPNLENALKQNKKIAKQMRSKNISLTEYPIENQAFFNNRDDHEFIFYQIILPQHMKQNNSLSQSSYEQMLKSNKQNIPIEKQNDQFNRSTEAQTNVQNSQHENHQNFEADEDSSNNTEKSDTYENNEDFFSQFDVTFKGLPYDEKQMLIVLCHGFQGSSYDMTMIHKGIKAQLPNANYLLSKKNQDDTESDIERMGEKLADQIKYFIRGFMDEQTVILNFVGHSMGGIIARASLKYLTKYKDQLGFYCSLSTPHLGYLNGVDNKIKAGLWVIRKWKPIKSLDQLSMEQTKNPRKTFLYKLSRSGTLKYFRKLIFFSSFEDSYVSWHSARVSSHSSKNEDSKIQNQMVQNILGLDHGKNRETTLHRLDINFNVKGNNIDSLIGRAAHINLIIQDSLFDVINNTLPQLFQLKEYGTGLATDKQFKLIKKDIAKKKTNRNSYTKQKQSSLTLYKSQ